MTETVFLLLPFAALHNKCRSCSLELLLVMTDIEFGRADLKLFIVTAFLHHHCPCNQRKRAMHLIPFLFLGLVVYSLGGCGGLRGPRDGWSCCLWMMTCFFYFFFLLSLIWCDLQCSQMRHRPKEMSAPCLNPWYSYLMGKRCPVQLGRGWARAAVGVQVSEGIIYERG